MKLTSDLHIHTYFSRCGKDSATVASYMNKARELGLKTLGFTDHMWDSAIDCKPGFYRGQDYEHIALLKTKLKEADTTGIDRILFGCECEYDYAHHGVGLTPEIAEKLDILLVPNSHTHLVMPKEFYEPPRRHAEFMLEAFYDIINSNVSKYITAIPHPFAAVCCSAYYSNRVPIATITDDEFKRCFSAAAEKGIALEINPVQYRGHKTREDIEADELIRMYRVAKECGCKFTIGLDSHSDHGQDCYELIYTIFDILGLNEDDLHPLAK